MCSNIMLVCGGSQMLSTSLCSAPKASPTAHCTLSEPNSFLCCTLMDCCKSRPSTQPNEDTEGRGGAVCALLYFWNGGWVHKGDRGHSAHKTKVATRGRGWSGWLWRGVQYRGRLPGEEESDEVSKQGGVKKKRKKPKGKEKMFFPVIQMKMQLWQWANVP